MSGPNGLHPVANLTERQKCPLNPTKRKYSDGAEAGREAQKRAKSTGLPIEAYMCEGCGNYHLTKGSRGGNGPLPDGKFTVGEFRAKAPSHPVFADNVTEEPPIVPGDHETRLRFAREFLLTHPTPTSDEMCEAIGGCTKDTLRRVMKDLGYRNTRGRYAHWVKNEPADDRTPLDTEYDNDAPEEPTRWHGGRDIPWREARLVDNLDRLRHIALGDLIDTYSAAGLTLVLSLEGKDA